jgi:hypothetical protein
LISDFVVLFPVHTENCRRMAAMVVQYKLQPVSRIGLSLQAHSRTDGHTAIPRTKFYVDIRKLKTALHNAYVVFLIPAYSKHRGKVLLKGVIC